MGDTNGDGNPDTLVWFNKKEHFHDAAPALLGGFTLWEMTQNFGYHLKDDGKCEVYHHGENFSGFFPMRLLFQLHSKYVIWATEKYVNSADFGAEDREDNLEEQRHNIPLHVFNLFIDRLAQELENSIACGTETEKKNQLEVTLKRLQTLSSTKSSGNKPLPHLRTLRSHKTNVTRAHLVIEDEETKDTIKAAMKQIGSSNGKRHEPVHELAKLARQATINYQRKQNQEK